MIARFNKLLVVLLDECMTLWGKPEQVHVLNVEQLHAHNCHQDVTEPEITEYRAKGTHMYNIGTVSQA